MSWWNPFSWGRVSLTDTREQFAAKVRAQGIQFFEYNGEIQYVSLENSTEYKSAYERCAPLSSIVGYMSKAFSDAKVEMLQENNGNYVRGKYKDWEKLMARPNTFQNCSQFLKQLYIYNKVNGFAVILKNEPSGFKGTGIPPKSMFVLPYWMIDIQESGKTLFDMADEDILDNMYFTNPLGGKTKLQKENLIIIRDTTGLVDERYYLPISRIAINRYPISTLVSSAEAEITMIQNRGAVGILSNQAADDAGHVPLQAGEKDELQREFSGYGLTRAQRQVIITNANLQWQPMNFPTRELMLHESYAKATKDLCDAFGMPYEILAHSDRKNLSNVKTFDKMLYQNSIIPDANDIAQQLSMGLGLDKLQSPICIHFDYSHVAAMQESEEEKGKGLEAMYGAYQKAWDLGIMTRNDIREAMGMDKMSEPEFNEYKWQTVDNETEEDGNNNTPVQE